MYEHHESVPAEVEQQARSEWVAPELRRLEAGSAKGSGGTGTDNTVFS